MAKGSELSGNCLPRRATPSVLFCTASPDELTHPSYDRKPTEQLSHPDWPPNARPKTIGVNRLSSAARNPIPGFCNFIFDPKLPLTHKLTQFAPKSAPQSAKLTS